MIWFGFVGKYYLVDSGYPNRVGYLAPFKGSTYHISEFRLRSGHPPQGKYEIFNFCIHPFKMSLSGLSECWSRSGVFCRTCQVSPLVLRSILFLLAWHCIILLVRAICMIKCSIDVMLKRTTYYKRHVAQPKHKEMRVQMGRMRIRWIPFAVE